TDAAVPKIIPILDQYAVIGETLSVNVTVMRDTGLTETRVLPGVTIHAEVSDGWRDTAVTDSNGGADFFYVPDSTEGPREIQFAVDGATRVTRQFTVTANKERVQKRITVMPEDAWIKADGKTSTIVTVTVINQDNNPIVGEAVKFISTKGTIAGLNPPDIEGGAGLSVTDGDGRAQARLTSTQINDTAEITVYHVSDSTLTAKTRVAFLGVRIDLALDSSNLEVGRSTVLTASLVDGSGNAIANRDISFSVAAGDSSPLSIAAADSLTGFDGKARLVVTGNQNGTDSIIVTAAGARSTITVNITDLVLRLTLSSSRLQVNSDAYALLIVEFANAQGTPLDDKIVELVRDYHTKDKTPVSDTVKGETNTEGVDTFTIAALDYETTMHLRVIAHNRAGDIASAQRRLDFVATRQMTIRATPTVIQADGTSRSILTVFVKNEQNNPIVGDRVLFSSTAGIVPASAETDETGKAVAWVQSDRRNTTATVTATLSNDRTKVQTIDVEFSGVEIVGGATPRSINADGQDTSVILITLVDAMKNPITGEPVSFAPQQEKTVIVTADSITDNRGQARCGIVGTGSGVDSVLITGAGAEAKAAINYSSNQLTIAALDNPTYLADGASSTKMGIRYTDGSGSTGLGGVPVEVSVTAGNLGEIFAAICTTAADGRDTVTITNPPFATTVTVCATAHYSSEVTTARKDFYFKASDVHRIELTGSPEVIATNGGEARIMAVAFDAEGNRVKDAHISSNMLDGPGGGERIVPPSAVTRLDGTAETFLLAGTIPSRFREIKVVASDFGTIKSDTIFFTIAGPPAAITIRRDIGEIQDNNDGTYTMRCAALVTDVNGNPVADGTAVTFSLKVTGYRIWWYYTHPTKKTTDVFPLEYEYVIDTVAEWLPFEDLNDNFRLDAGEDRNGDGIANRGEDRNGNGTMELGPAFEDINDNGVRDMVPERLDIVKVDEDTSGRDVFDTLFADLNLNGYRDFVEPLMDSEYQQAYNRILRDQGTTADSQLINSMDSTYWSEARQYTGGLFDIDWNQNGAMDPVTTASINRTIETVDGKASNSITYGQSDALRIRVMINAESQGIVTKSPQEFVLPIAEKDVKYWCPRCE
ncbi:MAG: hypothetical protein GF344_08825, partial [Chitinivibrionales bacterium]|nr:hypothetical protein [Chitinivibrionales bacterium]MBD3356961.1 hypothetical protein [Chitinivibrionales bacterium]